MNQNDEGAKIFVGGIGETGDEELRAYFAQYGTVKAVQVKYDPNTQRARGFGFIIFEDMSSVDQVWKLRTRMFYVKGTNGPMMRFSHVSPIDCKIICTSISVADGP